MRLFLYFLDEGEILSELLSNLFTAIPNIDLKGICKSLDCIHILLNSERESLVNIFIESEALPLMFEFLKKSYENCEHIQNTCTRILLNLAKNERFILISHEKNLYNLVVENLFAQSEDLRELTLRLLTSLSLISVDIRFALLSENLSQILMKMLQTTTLNPSLLLSCIKLVLATIQQKSTKEEIINEQYHLFDIFIELLDSDDILVLGEITLALCHIFETDDYKERATNQKLLDKLLFLAEIENSELKCNITNIIKNISSWGEDYSQYFLENKILNHVKGCLESTENNLKRSVIELLTTFFTQKLKFLQVVFDFEKNEIVKQLINIMKSGDDNLSKLAFQAATRACEAANFKEMKIIIDRGYLDLVAAVLKKPKDAQIKSLCEKSLEAIVYKTQEEFGREKHPMIMQCYMKVQAIVKSIYGTAPNNLTKAIGIISMENQKNYRPDSNI